jgi:hypothetical protein
MNFLPNRLLALAATVILMAFVTTACGAAAPASPLASAPTPAASEPPISTESPSATDADPNEAILAVETRGGRCVGGPCDNIVVVNRDGRVLLSAKPPNELGFVSADVMADLDRAIRTTDFAELMSRPFTGECPTASDGQELVVEVLTADGAQRIESCAVEIDYDSPLFAAISAAVGEYVPLLNQ